MDEIRIVDVKEPKYVNVPLPQEDHRALMRLCDHYGAGKRAQGAMVARLIREELRKLESLGEQAE
jgi:hypothetical protein